MASATAIKVIPTAPAQFTLSYGTGFMCWYGERLRIQAGQRRLSASTCRTKPPTAGTAPTSEGRLGSPPVGQQCRSEAEPGDRQHVQGTTERRGRADVGADSRRPDPGSKAGAGGQDHGAAHATAGLDAGTSADV